MMRRANRAKAVRGGFTLLEVLMVIVILGVLAALIVPQFGGTQRKAEERMTQTQIVGLKTQLDLFKMHCGRYPTSDEGLAVLLEPPDEEELVERWGGPYLDAAPKDAWGRELIYASPGEYNENSYDLSSMGHDGQEGTEDDITNWEKT